MTWEFSLPTKDEIILAYRLLLGRDPEDESVINSLLVKTHSVEELREIFYSSSEFIVRMGQILKTPQNVLQRHPFSLPRIPVEVGCSDEKLGQMIDRINNGWSSLGKNEPYWSVLTQPEFYLDKFEENRENFYGSGKYLVDTFLSSLRRNGINPNLIKSCLDFGCGVGRMLSPLSKSFSKIYAVDISQNHLMLAEGLASKEKISNVEFIHCFNLKCLKDLPSVDSFVSVITLQHNPPPLIFFQIKLLLGLLNPGGAAYFQVPTYRNGYIFEIERYLNSPPSNSMEMHFLPQGEIFRAITESNCICLEVREDAMVGNEGSMLSNSFIVQKKS